jgi:beta-ureidopropionase / N-carbamoyl-L-amino-acid hydrolase
MTVADPQARSVDDIASELRPIAVDLFDRLARETGDGIGITRECYAQGENFAINLFREAAEAHGLRTLVDPVGNLVVLSSDDDGRKPALYLGSHADSVPQGGNFDGGAGVVAALLCLIRARQERVAPLHPVRALIMRGEESAFYGRANIGSRALFGMIDAKDLAAARQGEGRTLAQAMADVGVDVAPIGRREILFDPASAIGFLELHIEQGPVMVARGWATAIVTGIRGNIRHRRIACRGEAGHSGAVPRWLRRDAVFAFADLVMRLDEHWAALLERGLDLVVTCGIVGTDPRQHALSRIPAELDFSFEVRSQSRDTLESFYELLRSATRAVAKERSVSFNFDERIYAEPAVMHESMKRRLTEATRQRRLPVELIASGAGHDAAVFANAGVPSGMLFVRNAHGSHNPAESMDLDDFMQAADVLYAAAFEAD